MKKIQLELWIEAQSIQEKYIKIINLNAKSIILAHNHPSDNITPSKCDIELTNEIAKGLKNFGALLIEHIIITKIPISVFGRRVNIN